MLFADWQALTRRCIATLSFIRSSWYVLQEHKVRHIRNIYNLRILNNEMPYEDRKRDNGGL